MVKVMAFFRNTYFQKNTYFWKKLRTFSCKKFCAQVPTWPWSSVYERQSAQ